MSMLVTNKYQYKKGSKASTHLFVDRKKQ
jgi:hypothetical protein